MSGWLRHVWRWAAGLAIVGCLCLQVTHAANPVADPDAFLKQTEQLRLKDHPRFLEQLAQLNQQASRLTPDQQWYLRQLNAWQAMYAGDYAKSGALLKDIIQHSGIPSRVDIASALLLDQLIITRHYIEAFELAGQLAARLPLVTDAKARSTMLYFS